MRRKGFTLIEVIVVVAILAILGAVLVPVIANNIREAKMARASSDVATIGKAIVQFRQDTGKWPFLVGAAQRRLLFSDTDANGDGIPDNSAIPAAWSAVGPADRLSLNYHMMAFNLAAPIVQGPSTQGLPCWNGPYLTKMALDPWGYPYMVNAQWLWPGNSGLVFVLSAGVNEVTNTNFDGSGALSGDDVGFRLQ